MFDLDECQCEKQCSECEDCFVAQCQCECEVETGLKEVPDEGDTDDDDLEEDNDDTQEEEGVMRAKELGIKIEQDDRMPEY